MDNQPPIYTPQPNKDDEHLKLLSLFHFVFGGLALLGGTAFLAIHFLILSAVVVHSRQWQAFNGSPPPEFYAGFIFFYVLMGAFFLATCILNILSGIFLRQKKHRIFSVVIAAIDCFQIPFGTALGVFTIIVLQHDSVRQS